MWYNLNINKLTELLTPTFLRKEKMLGARSNIDEPKKLEKIIKSIDELDWYSAKEEGLGNLYEGLLAKNVNKIIEFQDKKVLKSKGAVSKIQMEKIVGERLITDEK